MVDRAVEACVLLGVLILAIAAVRYRLEGDARALALTLVAGLGAVAMAQLAVGRVGFNACSVNYNLWMKPGLCLIGAAGLASKSGPSAAPRPPAGLLIASQGVGVVRLAAGATTSPTARIGRWPR